MCECVFQSLCVVARKQVTNRKSSKFFLNERQVMFTVSLYVLGKWVKLGYTSLWHFSFRCLSFLIQWKAGSPAAADPVLCALSELCPSCWQILTGQNAQGDSSMTAAQREEEDTERAVTWGKTKPNNSDWWPPPLKAGVLSLACTLRSSGELWKTPMRWVPPQTSCCDWSGVGPEHEDFKKPSQGDSHVQLSCSLSRP